MSSPPPINRSPRARAARTLRQWIDEGRYRSEPLPSERELARHLGVGRGTVRSVLGDLQAQGVLDLQGYRRTVTARAAGGGLMARTIALLTTYADIAAADRAGPPRGSLGRIATAALDRLGQRGYHGLTIRIDDLRPEIRDDLLARPPAGFLASDETVTSGRGLPLLRDLVAAGCAGVAFDQAPGLPDGVDRVLSDHAAGAAALCETLFARGHRRILRLWERRKRELPWVRERDRGFLAAHARAGIAAPEAAVIDLPDLGPTDAAAFDRSARELVAQVIEHLIGPQRVDALMLMSDAAVPCATRACELCQLEPGGEIAIVGYDAFHPGVPGVRFCPAPPLATIDKHNDRIGCCMADLVVDRIEGRAGPQPRTELLPVELVVTADPA